MESLCCFDKHFTPLVMDTSVVINLNATNCAPEAIKAIPNKFLMVDIVQEELKGGLPKGKKDAHMPLELVNAGLVQIVRLGKIGMSVFENMVTGSAAHTLDDGEAATIAFAVEANAIALIDENKATKICQKCLPELLLASTVDLLTHPKVINILGRDNLATAVFNALQISRMNVHPHHLDWVLDLIGSDKAALCKSLPKKVRSVI